MTNVPENYRKDLENRINQTAKKLYGYEGLKIKTLKPALVYTIEFTEQNGKSGIVAYIYPFSRIKFAYIADRNDMYFIFKEVLGSEGYQIEHPTAPVGRNLFLTHSQKEVFEIFVQS